MRNISNKSCRGNQNTHFVSIIFFPPKIYAIYEINVEIYCGAGQATDDNIVHAHCTLDN